MPEHFTLAPVFSTSPDLADPRSWTPPEPMIVEPRPDGKRPRWIDFWVICDRPARGRKAILYALRDEIAHAMRAFVESGEAHRHPDLLQVGLDRAR